MRARAFKEACLCTDLVALDQATGELVSRFGHQYVAAYVPRLVELADRRAA